jgi:endonuclease G
MHRPVLACAMVLVLGACEGSSPPPPLAQVRIVDLDAARRIEPLPWVDTPVAESEPSATESPSTEPPASPVDRSPHVALGVPRDADPSDDLLLDRRVYVLSYNPTRRATNWVAWKLVASDIGKAKRTDKWLVDDDLPADVFKARPEDYARSGYDRGHMCPSADRTASPTDNALTFLLTNALPQRADLNAGPWEKLEEFERHLALAKNKDVYIVAGAIFSPSPPVIGRALQVPNDFFKVIVALEQGKGASDIGDDALVFAAIMPNVTGIQKRPWTDYSTTIAAVEKASGYDFNARVPPAAQAKLEQRQDVATTTGPSTAPPPPSAKKGNPPAGGGVGKKKK